jgi:hypothetical protein
MVLQAAAADTHPFSLGLPVKEISDSCSFEVCAQKSPEYEPAAIEDHDLLPGVAPIKLVGTAICSTLR